MNAQRDPEDLLFDISRCAKHVAIAHGLLPNERVSISRRQGIGHQSLWGRKPHNPEPRGQKGAGLQAAEGVEASHPLVLSPPFPPNASPLSKPSLRGDQLHAPHSSLALTLGSTEAPRP